MQFVGFAALLGRPLAHVLNREAGDDGVLRDWLFEFEPLQAGDDAQHWLLQLREADPRPEGGR